MYYTLNEQRKQLFKDILDALGLKIQQPLPISCNIDHQKSEKPKRLVVTYVHKHCGYVQFDVEDFNGNDEETWGEDEILENVSLDDALQVLKHLEDLYPS